MMSTSKNERKKRTQRDYTLAFKLYVVAQVERGELTYKQAQKHYGIQGRSTVLVWLRKHGRLAWPSTPKSAAMKPTPAQRIKELEKEVKRLKESKFILETLIDVTEEDLGVSIRKKDLPGPSKESKS